MGAAVRIQIDPHTPERAEERGTNEAEIQEVINTGLPIPAKYGRMGRAKVFDFQQSRHGKYYAQKRVEVYFTAEVGAVTTVTVYVFFGRWGD